MVHFKTLHKSDIQLYELLFCAPCTTTDYLDFIFVS
jgi:hypothetical protein